MHSLQYDEIHEWRLGVLVGMWNVGSLCGNCEVCEEMRERIINVCCMQEVRWRGQSARMLGMKGRRYEL